MTKIIDVSDKTEPLPSWYNLPLSEPDIDPDKPVFDTGDGARKEPMTLVELEAAVIPAFQAQQRKYKPKPIKYESPEDYDARVREEHRVENARYYQGRPRPTGSETQRRSVNRLGRLVGEHGAHKIQGAYGAFKDAPTDTPAPTFQPPPEETAGYCGYCNKAIQYRGPRAMRADAKFCSVPHRDAFRYREAQRTKFNKLFNDYWETAAGKAEAILQADARHVAVVEMVASAKRAGIEAEFFATPTGVMARSDNPLPPIRAIALSNAEPYRIRADRYGRDLWDRRVAEQSIEVQTSEVPELGAILYTFSFPALQPGAIGKARWLSVGFLGDPGTGWNDGYPTQEQQEAIDSERAKNAAENAKWQREWRARAARRERAQAERIARGDLTGTTSARDAHAEEKMRNLLARSDRDVIIAEYKEAKDWFGLREFYAACRQQAEELVRATPDKRKPAALPPGREGNQRRRREDHRALLPAPVQNPNDLKPKLAFSGDNSN
jgi:hypothetical protein